MHEWINTLKLPLWVKIALRSALPYLVAAAVAWVEEYVRRTPNTVDDALFVKLKQFLVEQGILDSQMMLPPA